MADGDLSVGDLSGKVELEDNYSTKIDLLINKIDVLDEKMGGLGHTVAEMASGFFTAEAAMDLLKEGAHLLAETLKEITIEGSHAADIEETFTHLSGGVEHAEESLQSLREGTRGTVTDMELMTRVNQNLAAGLNLSAEQEKVMSEGAFALAKATGKDVAGALDTMSMAMVTGRVRGLQQLTGKIDLTQAEERYAEKLGTTTEHLSAHGKQLAIQEEILKKVEDATDRVGEPTVRLADKIEQVKVNWANFLEEVGTAIATSPVIAAGFDAIASALGAAFGDDQAKKVKTIATAIDDAAITAMNAAATIVDVFGTVGAVFENTKAGIYGMAYTLAELLDIGARAANVVSFGSMEGAVKSTSHAVEDLYNKMAVADAKSSEWATSSDKLKEVIEGVRQRMVEAKSAEGDYTDVIRDGKKAHDENAMAMTKEESVLKEWTKSDEAAAMASEKIWTQVAEDRAGLYKTDQEKAQINSIFKYDLAVKEAQSKGITDRSYYDGLWQLYLADTEKKNAQLAMNDKATREYYVHQRDLAVEAYDNAVKGVGTYTNEGIAKLHEKMVEATNDLSNWQKLADDSFGKVTDDVKKAADTVQLLDGEIVSLKEAQDKLHAGTSTQVTSTNFNEMVDQYNSNQAYYRQMGWGGGQNIDPNMALALAKQGYSFEDIIKMLTGVIRNPGAAGGPRIPGFDHGSGGIQDFGAGTLAMLHGREAVVKEGDMMRPSVNVYFSSMLTDAAAVEKAARLIGDKMIEISGAKFSSGL